MNTLPMDYLRNLVSDIPVLNEKLNRCFEYWENGAPPVMAPPVTIAFGDVGDAIVENLTTFSAEVRQKLFASIESGVTSPDVDLSTAMATGLVEALVSRSDRVPGSWEELESLLGPASKDHALWWRNYGK